jgi:hypothetical protein
MKIPFNFVSFTVDTKKQPSLHCIHIHNGLAFAWDWKNMTALPVPKDESLPTMIFRVTDILEASKDFQPDHLTVTKDGMMVGRKLLQPVEEGTFNITTDFLKRGETFSNINLPASSIPALIAALENIQGEAVNLSLIGEAQGATVLKVHDPKSLEISPVSFLNINSLESFSKGQGEEPKATGKQKSPAPRAREKPQEKTTPAKASTKIDATSAEVTENKDKGGIEIRFDGKPSDGIREKLRSNGFKFSARQAIWWTRHTDQKMEVANSISKELESFLTPA